MRVFRNDNNSSIGKDEPSPMKQVTTPSIPTKEQRDSGGSSSIKGGQSSEKDKTK